MIPKTPSGDESAERAAPTPAQPRAADEETPRARVESRRGAGVGTAPRGLGRFEEESWIPGGRGREDVPPPANAEVGAALERQLLLESAPVSSRRTPSPRLARGLLWTVLGALLLAVAGSGVFFFVQSRRTWEDRLNALRGQMEEAAADAARREQSLREEVAAREREVAERKAEVQSIARIADRTLDELKSSLEDHRRLNDAHARLQNEYREAVRRQESVLVRAFERWIPQWIQAASASPPPPEGSGQ